jgi:hypothetical protein
MVTLGLSLRISQAALRKGKIARAPNCFAVPIGNCEHTVRQSATASNKKAT